MDFHKAELGLFMKKYHSVKTFKMGGGTDLSLKTLLMINDYSCIHYSIKIIKSILSFFVNL